MGSIPTVSTTRISRNLPLDSLTKKYGGVAQLVRVFGSHPKGRGFESLRLHHFCTVRFDGLFFSVHFLFGPRALSAGAFLWSGLCCVGGSCPEKGRASFPDVGGEGEAAFGQASRHLWKGRHSLSRSGRGKGERGPVPFGGLESPAALCCGWAGPGHPGCQTVFWCVFAGEVSVRRAGECAVLAAVQPDMQGKRRRLAREICTKQAP